MTKTTHYKNTPIGPIPSDWEVKKLGEIGVFFKGKGVPKSSIINEGYKCLTYGDLYSKYNYIIKNVKTFIDEETAKISQQIVYGDICFAGSGETAEEIGKCAAFIDDKLGYAGGDIIVFRSIQNHPVTLSYFLNSEKVQQAKSKLGQGNSIVHIYSSQLENLQIPLPPLSEQQKIAEVLSTWDKAIQETDALIKKLEERNKALAFSLLTGKKRVKGFDSKWNQTNFGAITKKISRRNKDLIEAEVYSVTNSKGFVLQSEHFEGKVASEDLKTYKIIKNNEFAYNPARINVGSLAYFQNTVGIISSLYVCFKTTSEVSDEYLLAYLQTDYVHSRINALGEGGVRIYLWYELFSKIKINLPSLEEQNAIAGILNTANDELKQYQQKLETLKLQKKGLMQQLLTGKVRTV